jgi:hypothetical protein
MRLLSKNLTIPLNIYFCEALSVKVRLEGVHYLPGLHPPYIVPVKCCLVNVKHRLCPLKDRLILLRTFMLQEWLSKKLRFGGCVDDGFHYRLRLNINSIFFNLIYQFLKLVVKLVSVEFLIAFSYLHRHLLKKFFNLVL